MNGLKVMLFLGVTSALFFGLDAILRRLQLPHKSQSFVAWLVAAIAVATFGVLFGFDGLFVSSWPERARR